MAQHGYKMQLYPNGEFTVGYVRPAKFTPEPLPPKGVEVFSFDWLDDEHKHLVLDWVQEKLAAQEKVGLSTPANSTKRGLKGITSKGARMVRNAAYLMQQRFGKERLSFVTLTLPSCSKDELASIAAQWSHVVHMYCKELKRELKRHGLYTGFVGVTEIQERRLQRREELGLHLHLVHQGRLLRSQPWAIPPGFHRETWARILRRILGRDFDTRSLENVQAVKKDASGYLGKYLTKGTQSIGAVVEIYGEECIPSAWYTCANELRDAVKARVTTSWELAETVWIDLPIMEHEGVLVFTKLNTIEIEGRSFVVGLSGKWDMNRLQDAFPQYYYAMCHKRLR